jgi:L-asparaginase / beta-aspartyl-peptidase
MTEVVIAVHGGAGRPPPDREAAKQGVAAAVDAGHAELTAGGSALDAVVAAVEVLEDDPQFNAGRGAALTEDAQVELDASIMSGRDRAAGAVAAVHGVRHPVRAARAVLDEGRHVLLVGLAATDYARNTGLELLPDEWFITDDQRRRLERAHEVAAEGTVGAVALDSRGHLAAATSTGGIARQHRGRVGDSPLIGAGTWADDETVAVSCTGDGEAIIRSAMAHEVEALLRHGGRPVAEAAEEALAVLSRCGGTGGLIAVSADGSVTARCTTVAMPHAWRVGEGELRAAIGDGD